MSHTLRSAWTRATHQTWSALWLSVVVAACATRSTLPARPASSSCALTTASTPAPDSIAVVVTSAIGPPVRAGALPRTDGERFVHAQLYETLLALDCEGKLGPSLASSWKSDGAGRQIIRLRDDARFWNGAPVTATDVIDAWRTWSTASRTLADSSSAIDERTLALALPDSELRTLADPAFAVRRALANAAWPEGTGAYRVASEGPTRKGVLELLPVASDRTSPRILISTANDREARDRLDAGADLVVTRDADVIGYVAGRSDLQSIPLPWDRTYALLLPHALSSAPPGGPAADSARAALARDAVRGDARAAQGPHWWLDISRCSERASESSMTQPTSPSSVLYRADDRVARELAERLVALSEMARSSTSAAAVSELTPELRSPTRVIAHGLEAAAFEAALTASIPPFAYVIDLPSRPLASCAHLDLLSRARWRASYSAELLGLVALVETRAHAIVRRDRVSVVIDAMGTPRIVSETAR